METRDNLMPHPRQLYSISTLIFIVSHIAGASQYDALPLRSPLAKEPHFQTSQGRENHRFANAEINKYRLYDFYARQAKYNLAQDEPSELLLPYPGLEGGRRGHWGFTNEKLSSANLKRSKEPRYTRLINRGGSGNQFVCIPQGKSQAVCAFINGSPSLSKVILSANVRAPEHLFDHKIDRLGFDLHVKGTDYFINKGAEWHDTTGKSVPVDKNGYYLHQDHTIFSRTVAKVPLLDMPWVSYEDSVAIYSRVFEWQDQAPAFSFKLPQPAHKLNQPKVTTQQVANGHRVVLQDATHQAVYLIQSTSSNKQIKVEQKGLDLWVTFPAAEKGTMHQLSSWVSADKSKSSWTPSFKPKKLSTLLSGGQRHNDKDIIVKGQLNAEPAAKGSGYAVDEIPVPVENPYGIPMTTSGLAFGSDGSAYLTTLVGDVWKVTGLDQSLDKVKWQRFATGLNIPLGLEMVDDTLHVLTQHQILQLHDYNKDGEADHVKPFTKLRLPSNHPQDLQRDAQGNFYFSNVHGIHKISADGKRMSGISSESRNPLGIGVRADGLALSDTSEGNNANGTCTIYESAHPENKNTVAKDRRILYLPRGVDNSPGSRLFLNSKKFGPLGNSIIGVSYGSGRIYQIMRDSNHGHPQAALRLLPIEFSSGAARLEMNPQNDQLYVVGFDAWGDFAVIEGSFSRVRYTGEATLTPISWDSYSNGLSIKFNEKIDPKSIDASKLFLQQWNYRDSTHTYGSPEYSVKHPEKIGHDRLKVESVTFSGDGKEMFLNVPKLLPAMCTHIFADLKSTNGTKHQLNFFATINHLPAESMKGIQSANSKPQKLVVPFHPKNGNTYATLTEFFDKREGRDTFKRAEGPKVKWAKKDLNYKWINKNIIQAQSCIACHGAGSKHDFSTYPKLMKTINLKQPNKSHLLGMIETKSMPPFPMPTVPDDMQKALKKWIEMGAPK